MFDLGDQMAKEDRMVKLTGRQATNAFIGSKNISNYANQLKTETDLSKREIIEKLLIEELIKQVSHDTKLKRAAE